MKKITLLFLFAFVAFAANAQTFICSTADCGSGSTIISSAPTDGSTFYIVWFTTSSNTPVSATATPQPSSTSGTANIGSTTITNTSGTNYRFSFAASITQNQGKPTVSNVDVNLAFYTAASFPGTAGTASMAIPTANPLPVDFLDINVTSNVSSNKIVWSTASELNNDIFIVERSYDGIVWETAGEIKGAGNSSVILNYEFNDLAANTAVSSFYRIKQVDYNGTFDYSDVVKAKPVVGNVTIYPNPATSDEVTVNLTNDIDVFEVRNLAGQLMNVDIDITTKKINISSLSKGIYFITVNNHVVRFVK